MTCLRATHRQAQRLGESGRFEIGSMVNYYFKNIPIKAPIILQDKTVNDLIVNL